IPMDILYLCVVLLRGGKRTIQNSRSPYQKPQRNAKSAYLCATRYGQIVASALAGAKNGEKKRPRRAGRDSQP
ncbi:MAG TPA: hypothetical protein VMI06_07300, partial [Terriglobia bacterium]|nr:hypothetical protein [Terriglobia bacterium]